LLDLWQKGGARYDAAPVSEQHRSGARRQGFALSSSAGTVELLMLDHDIVAFIRSGVSITLAACARGRMPSMSRGFACKPLDGGAVIGIVLPRTQAAEALDNIRLTGRVAVAFTQPTTNRTTQLKGTDARVVAFDPADEPLVRKHIDEFVPEAVALGTPEEMVRALFSYQREDLVMVVFTPTSGFDQTPGPKAGQPLAPPP
jgi:hypothetical protein